MDEEMKSLQLDKPSNWKGKSTDELAKHSVESQFESKPIERSLHLLRKGDDVQKLSVIQALPQLLQYDSNATLTRIVPKIQQELPKSSCEFHIATSKIFKLLIEKQLPLNLVAAVIQGIDSKDPDVSNAWVETLVAVIPILPIDQIKQIVIPSALTKNQMTNPIFVRVNCCRVLGMCAGHPKLGNIDVKTVILPTVQSLCQDTAAEVRATMCSQLHFVAQGLGPNLVQSGLLPNLVELASDDNMIVRSSAVAAAVQMIPYLSKETKSETIIPLIKQLCQKTKDIGDTTFPMIARQFGKLVDALQAELSAADAIWFLQFFKTLAAKGAHLPNTKDNADTTQAVICREQCAYNLPAVTIFTVKRCTNQMDLWHEIFSKLSNDPCYLVRKTVAASVHEVAKILGPQCKIMKDNLIKLLRDDSDDILQMLVPNIGTTLELFSLNGVISRDQTNQSAMEIARAILKCHVELGKSNSWRIKAELLAQLECLPNCFPSDFIHQHFTPVMVNCMLQTRAKPLRSQAGRTLFIFLRYNSKEMQRKWIRDNVIQNMCYSKSCYTRQLFINVCHHGAKLFSSSYYKKHFFEPMIGLADDPVSNVRWSLIASLPEMYRMLVMPEDKKLQVSIDAIFKRMDGEEKDRDVKILFKEKLKEIRSPFENRQVWLADDKRKLDEESAILQGRPPMLVTATTQHLAQARQAQGGPPLAGAASAASVHTPREIGRTTTQRSASAPARIVKPSPSIVSGDMRFLEQHFYIDAGVNLPLPHPYDIDLDLTNSFEQKLHLDDDANEMAANISTIFNIEQMSETELEVLETTTTNITDDVKVNLRKRSIPLKKAKSENKGMLKLKRPASIYATSSDISIHRRSLNVGDLSKIPVCFKYNNSKSAMIKQRPRSEIFTKCNNSIETQLKDNIKIVPIKPSSLPIFKRK